MTEDIYRQLDLRMNSGIEATTGFTQLLAAKPFALTRDEILGYQQRLSTITTFQAIALQIFRAGLRKEMPPVVLKWLLNEAPAHVSEEYHSTLSNEHFSLPKFFRTDEVAPGRIAEVQCPGSLWGELQFLFDIRSLWPQAHSLKSPSNCFCSSLSAILSHRAIVHYLTDNCSAPAGVRYFIKSTRPDIKYYGYDAGVDPLACNVVRSHSFFGLVGDNYFKDRLRQVSEGKVLYDLPPHILFDQKATLVLPFWLPTRNAFPDSVRSILLFTTPIVSSKLQLEEGEISIEEFAKRPRSARGYYAKYAGCDVSLNWGSKAVYRLSNLNAGRCLEFLKDCIKDGLSGKIWLLQKEEVRDDHIEYFTRDGRVLCDRMRAKLSGFYGPDKCIGIVAMHRHNNKVHGQANTVLSPVVTI